MATASSTLCQKAVQLWVSLLLQSFSLRMNLRDHSACFHVNMYTFLFPLKSVLVCITLTEKTKTWEMIKQLVHYFYQVSTINYAPESRFCDISSSRNLKSQSQGDDDDCRVLPLCKVSYYPSIVNLCTVPWLFPFWRVQVSAATFANNLQFRQSRIDKLRSCLEMYTVCFPPRVW